MSILPKKPNKFSKKSEFISSTELAKFFNIESRELNQIFTNLKWIKKEHFIWWVATELGEKQGAVEYNSANNRIKYVYWKREIMHNTQLVSLVEKMVRTYIDNDIYENFIKNHYEEQDYTLWAYAKEKTQKNKNITFVAKRKKKIMLIHCRDNQLDISIDELKTFQRQRDEFIQNNPVFSGYDVSVHYVLSGFFLTEEAYTYIEESKEDISYEIIKSQSANQWLEILDLSKKKK